jgi:hypothetical protein
LFAIVLAMLLRPLQLPAASCILSNAPDRDPCKMGCCGNKTCCAVSKKNNAPVSPPLYKSGDVNQQPVIGFVSVPIIDLMAEAISAQPVGVSVPLRAHSPPLLATTCIRLI